MDEADGFSMKWGDVDRSYTLVTTASNLDRRQWACDVTSVNCKHTRRTVSVPLAMTTNIYKNKFHTLKARIKKHRGQMLGHVCPEKSQQNDSWKRRDLRVLDGYRWTKPTASP